MSATLSPSTTARSPAAEAAALRLSVVVPAYDEEGNIPLVAAAIHAALARAQIREYEVIIVDDGSRDRTAAEVRAEVAKDRRVRLLRLERNSGESAATEAGIRAACGDVIVTMDADLQNDPEDIPALLARIGEYDCVCGYRADRGDGDGLVRVVSSRLANAVRNVLSGDASEIRDSGCTFRAFRRECAARVKLFRGMHRFLPTLFRLEGYRVTEVRISNRPRKFGVSKYGVLNRAFAAAVDLLAVRWMASRVVPWRVIEDSRTS
jgi:dolichol-phosphate mannosyltransferase